MSKGNNGKIPVECAWCKKALMRRASSLHGNAFCSSLCFYEHKIKVVRLQHFWKQVIKTEGCWLWQGAVDKDGYGKYAFPGRAHRFVWEITYGPIPEGIMVCHNCQPLPDNPTCVRPTHLFLGTAKDNAIDAYNKGRRPPMQGETHIYAKLTTQNVIDICELRGKLSQRKIAKRYGITQSHVSTLQRGRTWNHVPRIAAQSMKNILPVHGENHHHAKLKDADIIPIFQKTIAGETQEEIAARYGVTRSVISLVLCRKKWRHIVVPPDLVAIACSRNN